MKLYGARSMTRPDADQKPIVEKLKKAGFSVELIGRPLDLLIGRDGVTILAEIKAPPGPRGGKSKKGQKLSDDQAEFVRDWKGSRPIVLTLETCVDKAMEAIFNGRLIGVEDPLRAIWRRWVRSGASGISG